jgi:hypothetical protein
MFCRFWYFVEKKKKIIRHGKLKTVVILPKTQRQKIISDTYSDIMSGHKSKNKTNNRIISSYWWPRMDIEINTTSRAVIHVKETEKTKGEVQLLLVPYPNVLNPNQRVHMDLFGSLKTMPSGKKFILCITDAFSKYAELVAILDKSAPAVASALFSK